MANKTLRIKDLIELLDELDPELEVWFNTGYYEYENLPMELDSNVFIIRDDVVEGNEVLMINSSGF